MSDRPHQIASLAPLLIFLISTSSVFAAELSNESVAEFKQQYFSAAEEGKIKLLREFAIAGPEHYGEVSIEIIENALQQDASEIQYLGFGALHRLATAAPDIIDARRFKPFIESALRKNDSLVRAQAVAVASALSQLDQSVGGVLPDALDVATSPAEAVDILRGLPPDTVRRPEVTNRLIAMSQRSAGPVSFAAARALVRSDVYPEELLPALIRLIQDDAYFGRAALTYGISAFGTEAKVYVPILIRVRDELRLDLTKPLSERTKSVQRYGDEVAGVTEDVGAVEALDRLIKSLQQRSGGPGQADRD